MPEAILHRLYNASLQRQCLHLGIQSDKKKGKGQEAHQIELIIRKRRKGDKEKRGKEEKGKKRKGAKKKREKKKRGRTEKGKIEEDATGEEISKGNYCRRTKERVRIRQSKEG